MDIFSYKVKDVILMEKDLARAAKAPIRGGDIYAKSNVR